MYAVNTVHNSLFKNTVHMSTATQANDLPQLMILILNNFFAVFKWYSRNFNQLKPTYIFYLCTQFYCISQDQL